MHNPWVISCIGVSIVFVVLSLVALSIWLIGWIDLKKEKSIETKEVAESSSETSTDEAAIDPVTLVLISAAVAAVCKGHGRIRRIRRIESQTSSWQNAARSEVHGSHWFSRDSRSRS